MKAGKRAGKTCGIDGCGRALSSAGMCWSHRKQDAERQARLEHAAARVAADAPGEQPFQVVTSCTVCGELDVTSMPPAAPPARDAVRQAAVLVWQALHQPCDGQIDVALFAAEAATSWNFAGEAPFIRGTLKP